MTFTGGLEGCSLKGVGTNLQQHTQEPTTDHCMFRDGTAAASARQRTLFSSPGTSFGIMMTLAPFLAVSTPARAHVIPASNNMRPLRLCDDGSPQSRLSPPFGLSIFGGGHLRLVDHLIGQNRAGTSHTVFAARDIAPSVLATG